MLQRMSEGVNETDIIRRLPCEVGISLCAGKTEDKEKLQGPRPALRLDPTLVGVIAESVLKRTLSGIQER
jgi:hypothetical protein